MPPRRGGGRTIAATLFSRRRTGDGGRRHHCWPNGNGASAKLPAVLLRQKEELGVRLSFCHHRRCRRRRVEKSSATAIHHWRKTEEPPPPLLPEAWSSLCSRRTVNGDPLTHAAGLLRRMTPEAEKDASEKAAVDAYRRDEPEKSGEPMESR
nr:hypothetical protein Itr_chr03CG07980 [Ipomoea trifida]